MFENSAASMRISRLKGKPLLGYNNDNLNLDVSRMILPHQICIRHFFCRRGPAWSDIKTKKCGFAPKLQWCKDRFLKYDEQICAAEMCLKCSSWWGKVVLPTNDGLKRNKECMKYSKRFNEVNLIWKKLQKFNYNFEDFRVALDFVLDTLSEMKANKKPIFYHCKPDGAYISERSYILQNTDFEFRVAKLWTGKSKQLKRAENQL